MRTILLIRNAAPTDFGGAERFPTFVAKILKNEGYRPIIVSGSRSVRQFATDNAIDIQKSPWLTHQNWSGLFALLFPFYTLWQLILTVFYIFLIAKTRPLALHVQSKDDFIAATLAGRLTNTTVVWNDHADLKHVWKNIGIWYKNPSGKLVYWAAHFAHAIIVSSKSEASFITEHISPTSFVWRKLALVYNGCEDAYDSVEHTKQKNFTFCIANRLVTDKGLGETIDAFKRFQLKYPSSTLLILGDGPEADDFKERAGDNKNIVFLGHQSNPYGQIAKSDVFLQPTYHDAFSVVIVEACMLGMPIIATAVGGNREIIFHEKTGLLIPSKNTDALFDAMVRLKTDDKLRNTLQQKARELYLERFVFNVIVTTNIIPLYQRKKPAGLTQKDLSL